MPKKILIIDDDPAMVEFLQELFQDNGYETVAAFDGAEGLKKAETEQPDLVSLDMDMPAKGGTLFYAGLRRNEQLRDTPVVVVSGVGPRPPSLTKNVPVLTKPVDNDQLLEQVRAFIG